MNRRSADARARRNRLIAAVAVVVIVVGAAIGYAIGKGSGSHGSDASASPAAGGSAAAGATTPGADAGTTGGDSDSGSDSASSDSSADEGLPLPGAINGAPPWPANNGAQFEARLRRIGLPALPRPGSATQLHVHVAIDFERLHVGLPAKIGVDPRGRFLAPLTTRDASGIVHVGSPTRATFTLGQFFDVWGVDLAPDDFGGQPVGNGMVLRVWANGKPVKGDPGRFPLADGQEIFIAYGRPSEIPRHVPSSFAFPAGG